MRDRYFPMGVAVLTGLPHREGIQVGFALHEMDHHLEIFDHPKPLAEFLLAICEALLRKSQESGVHAAIGGLFAHALGFPGVAA